MKVLHVFKASDIPRAPVDGKPTVIYWDILGLVQGIRIALAFAGVDFVDVRIDAGDPNNNYKGEWFSMKQSLEEIMPFPNLPYYLDQDVSLSQSNSIIRYIGRKYNLMGDKGREHLVDMCLDQILDEETQMTDYAYPKGGNAVREWYEKNGPGILSRWTNTITGKQYITGDLFSVADAKLFALLYKFLVIQDQLGTKQTEGMMSQELKDYYHQIEIHPRLKHYIESKDYQKHPLNNPAAKWKG